MLNFFRKRASMVRIVFGILLFLVCISMVVTLIPGLTGVSTDAMSNETIATIDGERISSMDLRMAVQQQTQANRVPPSMAWLYTQQVLDQMLLEKLALQEAQHMGLRVSQQEVVAWLKRNPEIFPGGNFVGHDQYEAIVLERFGYTIPQFEQKVRDFILTEKLRQLITDSVTVTDKEIKDAYMAENEKVVLSYVFLEPDNFKKDVNVSDAALQDYYNQHKEQYQKPETRSVRIIMLDNQKAREGLTVTDAERKKYYQDNIESYRTPERVQVSHILIKVPDKDPAKLEAAKKKAEDLLKQLKAGAKFDDLAKKYSEDVATAVKGGDLGFITRGQTVPECGKVAFSLAPGTLSDPVQTDFGIHIIKVQAHEQARLKPLEEVQGAIDAAILDEKVQSMLAQKAEQAAEAWRKAPENAAAIAQQFGGTVLTPAPVARDTGVVMLPNSQPLTEDIFILQKGEIGRPVALTSGYAIPQLLEITPAHPAEFAEVKDKVRGDYVNSQASDKMFAKAQELMGVLDKQGEKKDLAAAAKS